MLLKTIFTIAAFIHISLYSSTCSAITINDNGFDVEVLHKEKSDDLHVWGKVSGGQNCKELQLKILMKNNSARIAKVVASIGGYNGGWPGPHTFKGTGDLIKEKTKITLKTKPGEVRWFLEAVETKCLN